jgi:hypothetical protein
MDSAHDPACAVRPVPQTSAAEGLPCHELCLHACKVLHMRARTATQQQWPGSWPGAAACAALPGPQLPPGLAQACASCAGCLRCHWDLSSPQPLGRPAHPTLTTCDIR